MRPLASDLIPPIISPKMLREAATLQPYKSEIISGAKRHRSPQLNGKQSDAGARGYKNGKRENATRYFMARAGLGTACRTSLLEESQSDRFAPCRKPPLRHTSGWTSKDAPGLT